MTNKEKMTAGQLYDAYDPELAEAREYVRQRAIEFNQTNENEQKKRQELLTKMVGALGSDVHVEPAIRFDYGFNTFIGDNCYFNFNTTFLDCAPIKVGDNVLVGPNVSFLTSVHPLVAEERMIRRDLKGEPKLLEWAEPITVGKNVWIAGGVTINPGVTIGDNSVIGSGSVVTKDIPEGVFAAGVPCRVIREITEEDRVK